MPPAEVPSRWKVGSYARVDKDCSARNTKDGQFVVCVGAEASSPETPELLDLGTFAVVDRDDEAQEISQVLVSGAVGPFMSTDLPRPADFQFNSLLIAVSKSVICQVTSNWRIMTEAGRASSTIQIQYSTIQYNTVQNIELESLQYSQQLWNRLTNSTCAGEGAQSRKVSNTPLGQFPVKGKWPRSIRAGHR